MVRVPLLHRRKDVAHRGHRAVLDARAELPQRRRVRVARLGAEVGHDQRLLERDSGRHDLTVDRPQRLVADRPAVLGGHLAQHRVLTLRHINLPAGVALHPPDLGGQRQSLVEQLHQTAIEGIDLLANRTQLHVRRSPPACPRPLPPVTTPPSRAAIARRPAPCRCRLADGWWMWSSATRRSGARRERRTPATRPGT